MFARIHGLLLLLLFGKNLSHSPPFFLGRDDDVKLDSTAFEVQRKRPSVGFHVLQSHYLESGGVHSVYGRFARTSIFGKHNVTVGRTPSFLED